MSKNIFRTFFHLAVSMILVFVFSGGDCLTDDNPLNKIEPPLSLKLVLSENAGGDASAIVSWSASIDENDPDFNGYSVGTYRLNSSNQVVAHYQSDTTFADTFMIVSPIERNTRYISYVTALSKEKRNSDSIATKVYSGVYEDTSNTITITNAIPAGTFGWNTTDGSDSTYTLNIANSSFIDLIFTSQGSNRNFISPNQYPPGSKVTRIELIGDGLSAYTETELTDPTSLTPVIIEEDNVYLLRTQDNFYIKLWVRDITPSIGLPAEVTVKFDYKLQSIAGLLVL